FITKIAKRKNLLSKEVLNSLSALIYCKALDTITLRELIDSNGRLIPKAPEPAWRYAGKAAQGKAAKGKAAQGKAVKGKVAIGKAAKGKATKCKAEQGKAAQPSDKGLDF
nr:hypothetical chloroplast RF1, plastidic [Tanacetum cinerariifolium]